MAKQRKSSEMQLEIQKLRRQGLSIHKIACALRIHRKTVRRYLDPGDACYLAPTEVPEEESSWEREAPWEEILEELRRGVP